LKKDPLNPGGATTNRILLRQALPPINKIDPLNPGGATTNRILLRQVLPAVNNICAALAILHQNVPKVNIFAIKQYVSIEIFTISFGNNFFGPINIL